MKAFLDYVFSLVNIKVNYFYSALHICVFVRIDKYNKDLNLLHFIGNRWVQYTSVLERTYRDFFVMIKLFDKFNTLRFY